MNNSYDENSIKIMEGLDAVRKRPGMYIGSTDKRGLHHLAWEIIDNSIDEISNGYGDYIKIIIHKDNSLTISDNGRGVPVGMHSSGISTPEVIYTILHAGGKFEEGGYKTSGGLHGVGASVVNALSSYLKVEIKRDGFKYEIEFNNGGKVLSPLTKLDKTNRTGTTVTFMPDKEIFKDAKFSFTAISERMQEVAFLIKNITIEVIDEDGDKKNLYHYDDGLKEFVNFIDEDLEPLCDTLYFSGTKNDIEVEIAMQYTNNYSENIISFVNNVKTVDGGTHELGFKSALTRILNDYAKKNNILKSKDKTFEGSDVREGLTAIISVKIPESILQFESQTKSKLGTPIARSSVDTVVSEKLPFYLEENNKIASILIDKIQKSKQAREAARKAREDIRKGKNSSKNLTLSGKLVPAQSKDKTKKELFLVEGNSAGGSAKGGRDRKYQAILPLRGKIINTEKAKEADILANEEIATIISTIGAGYGSNFDVNEMEYDKIIIMTDADFDGSHIQCLLLTFFYRFMKDLVDHGKLYIAMPPLYKMTFSNKKSIYVYTDQEKNELSEKNEVINIQRYKGLGEMNSSELAETTMNVDTRSLIKVVNEDKLLSDKRISVLMGEDVEPRKAWIEENVDFTMEDDFGKENLK
ncbi:MAG: DNA topoisomerase IV subunit B [Clostridiales bacterium]|nr:DNA topoisomerase IV subunit B [Clostridiales bacterium]